MKYRFVLLAVACFPFCILFFGYAAQAAAIKYSCDFPKFASPEGLSPAKSFSMEFAYDTISEKAVLIGNAGVTQVFPMNGRDGISFVEMLVTGAVQTTTVTKSGKAVHSRNTLIDGDLVPSQYYGQCEIKRSSPPLGKK